jgi:parallel beta-helix repeat protein
MKKNSAILACLTFLITHSLFATVINVPADQPTIQAGIDVSVSGDTVLVDIGHYFEVISFKGKSILVTSRFVFEGDASLVESTIIDGSSNAQDDTASVVRFVSNEGPEAALVGFTILGGAGTVGMNRERRKGGGIFCLLASPVIKYNVIGPNSAFDGGGIYLFQSQAVLERNVIANNESQWGGGILSKRSEGLIVNNTLDGNWAERSGAGIAVEGPEMPVIRNNIISNSAGSALYVAGDDSLFVDYNDTYGNRARYEGSVTEGRGEIHCDPLFVNSEEGNYDLRALSPCIDAGSLDYTGVPPHGGDRIDIGAWEYYYDVTCEFIKFFNTPTEGSPCDTVYWDVKLTNRTDSTQVYDVWVDVSGPKCKLWDYVFDLEFPPHTTYTGTVGLYIPCCAPAGLYVAKGKVGVFDEFIFTAEAFEGEVVEETPFQDARIVRPSDEWWVGIDIEGKLAVDPVTEY